MERYVHKSKYFYGNEISKYGLENGYVDCRTLSKAFDGVMSNDIINKTQDIGYWELCNGSEAYYVNDDGEYITYEEYEEFGGEEIYHDVFQCYIISKFGAEILERYTDEIVYYNEELDMYVWGVTHCGTSWDYVLTDIPIELEE